MAEGDFMTRDIYEAAAIHAVGYPVKGVIREGETCFFLFDDGNMCDVLVRDYRNKEMTVDAKTLIESLRTMKDFIYNTTRRSGDGRN